MGSKKKLKKKQNNRINIYELSSKRRGRESKKELGRVPDSGTDFLIAYVSHGGDAH